MDKQLKPSSRHVDFDSIMAYAAVTNDYNPIHVDIDFAKSTSNTTFGTIGVKVWIFKGEKVEDRRGSTYSSAQ